MPVFAYLKLMFMFLSLWNENRKALSYKSFYDSIN